MQTKEEALLAGKLKLQEFKAKKAQQEAAKNKKKTNGVTNGASTHLNGAPDIDQSNHEEARRLREDLASASVSAASAAERAEVAEAKVSALEKEVNMLQAQLARSQSSQSAAEAECAAAREAMAEADQRCQEAESGRMEAEERCQEAEAACARALQDAAQERSQRVAVSGEREAWHRSRDTLATQLRLAQKQIQEAEDEQVRAEEEAGALRVELAALKEEHETRMYATAHNTDHDNARDYTEGPSGSSASTRALQEQHEEERARLAAELADTHAKLADSKSRLSEAEGNLAESEKTARVLEDRCRALSHQTHTRSSLEGASAEHKKQHQQLQHQLHALGQREMELRQREDVMTRREEELLTRHRVSGRDPSSSSSPSDGNGVGGAGVTPQTQSGVGVTGGGGTLVGGVEAGGERVHRASEGSSGTTSSSEKELRKQVERLESSRRKLLLEVEKQGVEVERLMSESELLARGLREKQAAAALWQAQVEEGLAHSAQLTELLAEQAAWVVETESASLSSELMQERARVSHLELKVQELHHTLATVRATNADVTRQYYPILGSIESKLIQMSQANAIVGDSVL